MASRDDMLPPYGSILGGGGDLPMGAPAFFSEDPDVEARAQEAIEVGEGGGICESCIHFTPPSSCDGFGGPLTVQPDRIVRCAAFRPTLGGAGGPVGPDIGGGLPPMY